MVPYMGPRGPSNLVSAFDVGAMERLLESEDSSSSASWSDSADGPGPSSVVPSIFVVSRVFPAVAATFYEEIELLALAAQSWPCGLVALPILSSCVFIW